MAALLARRYQPGELSGLSRQLQEAEAGLAAVEEQNERAHRRQERVARMHAAGKITAFDIANMQDLDEPDGGRAQQLARRCDRLRAQIAGASERITPAPVVEDVFTSARRAAHEAYRAATWEAVTASRGEDASTPRAPRPFAGPGAAGAPDCAECAAAGATRSESAQIHAEARRDAAVAAAPYWPGDVITTGYEAVR
jgi:hypothetical protein